MSASPFRLPDPAGSLLDRSKRISFRFDGKVYEAFAGDTIASALAANGVYLLSRSFKYHRPRGILTGVGHDANCLVQVGSVPNVHADTTPVVEGMDVDGQNYRGTLLRDRYSMLEKLGRFLPVGFYYSSFFRPRGIWERLWEPMFRRRAGLGRVDTAAKHIHTEKQFLFCDVAVIGAGPAGLSAARAAADNGAEVVLVNEEVQRGGALSWARFPDSKDKIGELVAAIERRPRITLLDRAACTGVYSDNWLSIMTPDRLYKLRARAVVFATGCIEQPLVFRNNDLPGVMCCSAAQRLIRLYGVKPGRRSVVIAGHDDDFGVALDLKEAGVVVAGIFDLRGRAGVSPTAAEAAKAGIPVAAARRINEAIADSTGHRVGRCVIDGISIECDLICMSAGYMPAFHLAAQAGAQIEHDERKSRLILRSIPTGIYIAGSLAGCEDLTRAIADGERVGHAAAGGNGPFVEELVEPPVDQIVNTIFPNAKGKEFVDFDEDLQVGDIAETLAKGYSHIELLKRYSTVGMGPSQGRHSALNTARIVAESTDGFRPGPRFTTARPPVRAEPLGLLAGQGFHPERRTPMHERHLEMGAQMMAVGAWWRPLFYGAHSEFESAAEAEVAAVHDGAGMIDVSTLGKFEIRGPDAAQFVDRLYTFNHLKQPLGRIRYLLMTNEAGTLVDDGVAARLGEQHFYLTATTGAADTTFRQMLWWNAQWRLKVDVANVTSGIAAINVAGPRSRTILQALGTNIDLSRDNFPHLHVRGGTLADIPVRLLRVGFLGELSYEVHAPASYGEALWDAFMEAGKPHGMRALGIEAQRRLRLEKGHIIIGQDTDELTTPAAAGMDWAIGKEKAFFVGARSIAARKKFPVKRQVAGFTLPFDSPVPAESSLVIENGEMVGQVTSCFRSHRCGAVIGLALIDPRLASIGATIAIRLPDRREVLATIVKPPFYDPNGGRQQL